MSAVWAAEVVAGGLVSDGASVQDDLRREVVRRLEQDGIHVGMRRDAARFGLHDLCPPHLASFGRGVGVERHILCLERCRMMAVLTENAAESRVDDAFACVGTGADEHNRFERLRHVSHKKTDFGCKAKKRFGNGTGFGGCIFLYRNIKLYKNHLTNKKSI